MSLANDPHRPAVTTLDAFCLANDIETGELANVSDISRQQLARLRYGKADTTIAHAKKIARGASNIVGRKVRIAELFDLGDYG